jgi:hypothetical protein
VGLNDLATLVHEVEERLGQACGVVSPGLRDLLHQVVDYLEALIGWLRRGPAAFLGTTVLPTSGPGAILPQAALPPDPSADSAPAGTELIPTAQSPPAEGPIRVPARGSTSPKPGFRADRAGRFWLSEAESMKTFAATVQDYQRLLESLGPIARRPVAKPGPMR